VTCSINQFKARWVAKGYTQRFSINYDSTFSMVLCIENLLLTFANMHNLKIHQVNVNTAFLHAKLAKEIYISQPEGFINMQQPNYISQLHSCSSRHHSSGTRPSTPIYTSPTLRPPSQTCVSTFITAIIWPSCTLHQ